MTAPLMRTIETAKRGSVPPPNPGVEWRGPVKWSWFGMRRRAHLLEQRVDELERRLAWIERQLSDGRAT